MPFGKWKDFSDCVQDIMKAQGKDEESAKKICGALQARLGKESFSWVGDIQTHERNLIRGKAIHPIVTVHPEEWPSVRVYLEEELEKAAHSLAGTPLFLDHLHPIDGKVLDAKYEDGAIEYIAELNDEEVLSLIRNGSIRHVSVEYDWSSLQRVNGVAPLGIRFTGLALLKNFEPGDPQTSVEIWKQVAEALKEARLKGFEQRIQEAEREVEALRNQVNALTDQKKTLEEAVERLEKEKAELTKKLGEGVIEPGSRAEAPEGYVAADDILKSIPRWIPPHWGYGPYKVLNEIRMKCGRSRLRKVMDRRGS